jgi:transcriptional regulator with XRE-family HTH domain
MTGAQLQSLRHRLKLTQAKLGDALGVTGNTVARWEREELPIRKRTAVALELLAAEARRTGRAAKGRSR